MFNLMSRDRLIGEQSNSDCVKSLFLCWLFTVNFKSRLALEQQKELKTHERTRNGNSQKPNSALPRHNRQVRCQGESSQVHRRLHRQPKPGKTRLQTLKSC